MNLKGRIERMEQQGGRRDDERLAVKLVRWLATAPQTMVKRDCRSNIGLLDLANRLHGLSPVELAAELDAARTDCNILTRVRNSA